MKKVVTYIHRGLIERPHNGRFVWTDGYSEDGPIGPLYPWMTKKEARHDARRQGANAVFKERPEPCLTPPMRSRQP